MRKGILQPLTGIEEFRGSSERRDTSSGFKKNFGGSCVYQQVINWKDFSWVKYDLLLPFVK